MQEIPISPVAFQSIKVPLSGKSVQLDIQQRTNGLYISIWLSSKMIMAGIVCQNRTWIVRSAYLGMPGDLTFIDTAGKSDPEYSGLGSRYRLYYQEGQNV